MLKIFGLFLVLVLGGCSQSTEPTASAAANAQDSTGSENGATDEPPAPTGYTDYIWCSKGENYSPEALDARNAEWLEGLAGLGIVELGVVEVTPSNWSSDKFDWISVLFWPDKAARDSAWADYEASGLEELLEAAHPGVEVCGGENWENVFSTIAYQIRSPELGEVFKVGYQFCSFRDGMQRDDLRTVIRGPWADFLVRYDAENPDSTYGTVVSVPDFDASSGDRHEGVPASWDLLWVNVWGDPAESEFGQAAVDIYGQEMMAAFDKVTECTDDQMYDGRIIVLGTE